MQLNKVFKGMLIALPVVTMMACSSNNADEMSEAEANRAAQEQAEMERQRREAEAAAVANAAKPVMSATEMREQKLQELRNEQVVYFDFDRSAIRSDAYPILDKHADFLIKNPNQKIVIEGHCDERGTPEYNIALGERRAKSVETYLVNAGVNPSQLSVVSYGEEKPAVVGGGQSAFAKNRRGVLVYQ
ncbi:peptidoglycan-associated lipoprotein Pal [Aestuariibacter sp. AA17]|uniref:Peptidoglycan-associated lipoprotein n=1 Tax=Fluctibacter corallii TaxID=2984329 RepID=A0ABT3AA29_9ALTE|nr:peptidoglycan-associated lipoprotein Pal [Aestuariibacter sp. AA17]MCV2885543.1 peptidoglycan-associated lipoprotein Pal [Aestuariibacter sp. AA17]